MYPAVTNGEKNGLPKRNGFPKNGLPKKNEFLKK
jgi:hypothetical protein